METFADYQRYNDYLKSLEPKEIKGTAHPQDLEYYYRLLKRLKELQDYSGTKKWFVPGTYLSIDNYPRHKLFFDATRNYRQTMFMAGNRIGKTEAGAFAASSWATGIYPEWWTGWRPDYPTKGWIAGDTNQTVRDVLQVKLLGPRGQWGTGMIPKENILDVSIKQNAGGAVDTVVVRHEPTGKPSFIGFKQYQQGATSFYGDARDWVWLDEEPVGRDAVLIVDECLKRLMTTDGRMIITFTPLHGLTPTVMDFKENSDVLTEGL